jgi:hypothetical protein
MIAPADAELESRQAGGGERHNGFTVREIVRVSRTVSKHSPVTGLDAMQKS